MPRKRRKINPLSTELEPGRVDAIINEMIRYGRGSSLPNNFDLENAKVSKDLLREEKGEEYYIVEVKSFTSTETIGFGFRAKVEQGLVLTDRYRDKKTGRFAPKWKAKRWPKRFVQVGSVGEWKVRSGPIITTDRPYPEKRAGKGFKRAGRF